MLIFIINYFFKENNELSGIYKKSSVITCLIIFGVILGLRFGFETLIIFSRIFKILNNDVLYFAIMVTIYYLLYNSLLNKFGISRTLNENIGIINKFKKAILMLMVLSWVITGIIIPISILRIPMNNPDIFNLHLFWTVSIVFIDILFTSLLNKALKNEKRIAKKIIKKSMYTAGFIALGIWFIQLIIFELYLNRWLEIELISQDIRVSIIVVSGLYIIFFLNFMKTKFLPESSELSAKRIQSLLQAKIAMQSSKHSNSDSSELLLKEITTDLEDKDATYRVPEGISLKFYSYFIKKDILSSTEIKPKFITPGIFWGITLGIFISLMILTSFINNRIIEVILLSLTCSLFMVIGDISLIILFNRINPSEKRIPNSILQRVTIVGGIITLWIWMVPFFILYAYLFILITETLIIDITYVVIFSYIILNLGIRILKWYAAAVKMWGTPKTRAFKINFAWFILNVPIRIFFLFNLENIILRELVIVGINIIIGSLLVSKFYKRKITEAIKFTLAVQVILLFVIFFIENILSFSQSLILAYHYDLDDIRVLFIISIAIYLVSIVLLSKIKFKPDSGKKIKEKVQNILKTTYEEDQEGFSSEIEDNVILEVNDLTTYFYTEEGVVKAVEGVSFKIHEGEVLGLVGETGCGKSVTALSILRIVRPPGKIESGEVIFYGEELHKKSPQDFLKYRGKEITMIFQDPLNSLNPVFKIGDQISEVYRLHMEDELLIESAKSNKSIYEIARKWSQKMLKDLNIPTPRVIFDRYPHELSGGMRQRVQIAMALACSPKLLIADEPTTALDVTIQNQILKLMKDLKKKYNTSILFITHDLGIISKMCDRVAVMYSGFVVEYGDINKLFRTPYHPYTRGLISSVPVVGKKKEILEVIPGMVPNLIYPPSGCRFHPRCQYCFEPCDSQIPRSVELEPEYFVACHLYNPEYKDLAEESIKKVEN